MRTAPAPTCATQAAVKLRDSFHAGLREVVMTPLLPIAAVLLQLPVTPPGFPVARLEITPAAAAVEVGQQGRLTARAFDAAGQTVPRAQIEWFAAGYEGGLDPTGLVTGSYGDVARLAAVAGRPGVRGEKLPLVLVRLLPKAPSASG